MYQGIREMTKREEMRTQQPKPETHETQWLPISKVATNKGQIEGLPANPRFIRNDRYEKLKKSIQEDPEMTTLREVLVVPRGKAFVIIGGNMRYQAFKELGWKQIPCKVLPEGTDAKKLRAIATKDNVNFGDWDHDLLANEWNEIELLEWGVPAWDTDIQADDNSKEKEAASKDTACEISVSIPIELKEKAGEIELAVREALITYVGVKITYKQ